MAVSAILGNGMPRLGTELPLLFSVALSAKTDPISIAYSTCATCFFPDIQPDIQRSFSCLN
jgi:hypothetical protein